MDKSLQKKLKPETKETFAKIAYQQLLQAAFMQREFDDMNANLTKATETINKNDEEVRMIKKRMDHHTVENRNRMKELETVNIGLRETVRSLQTMMQGVDMEIKQFSQKGARYLKLADYVDEFEIAEKIS